MGALANKDVGPGKHPTRGIVVKKTNPADPRGLNFQQFPTIPRGTGHLLTKTLQFSPVSSQKYPVLNVVALADPGTDKVYFVSLRGLLKNELLQGLERLWDAVASGEDPEYVDIEKLDVLLKTLTVSGLRRPMFGRRPTVRNVIFGLEEVDAPGGGIVSNRPARGE